jgi:predicted choloylglycine hydrolase
MRSRLLLAGFLVGSLSHAQAQEVVAGKATDLMIVRHVVLRGTNEAIGKRLAQIAAKVHKAKPTPMEPAVLEQRLSWFKADYPEVIARAKGVQSAVPGAAKGTDFTSLPYDMDVNPACSVVFYPGSAVSNGHAMLSRNYDFPKGTYAQITRRQGPANARSMTGDPYVIEMHPDKGYASLYICAYDLLQGAIDGVNEKGVSVALLADDMSSKRTRGTAGVGLGEIDLPRFVLDKASSAKEARRLLTKVPYYSTFTACHYIISDASGDSFIFEVDENNRHHVIEGGRKPQLITNHSIAKYGTNGLPAGNSFDRYRRLQQEIAKRRGRVTPADVKEINYCVAVPTDVRVHGTLWHAVYDLTDRSVSVSFCLSGPTENRERRSPYLNFRLGR